MYYRDVALEYFNFYYIQQKAAEKRSRKKKSGLREAFSINFVVQNTYKNSFSGARIHHIKE